MLLLSDVATEPVSPFDLISARAVVAIAIVTGGVSLAALLFVSPGLESHALTARPWAAFGLIGLSDVLILIATSFYATRAGIRIQDLFGPWPSWRQVPAVAAFAVPIIGLSWVALYLFYVPLSLLRPHWAIPSPPIPDDLPGVPSAVENAAMLALVAGLVPVTEEWVFRGLLLRRLCRKWGVTQGVLWSSAIFGIFHAEFVHAFVVGIALCGVYAQYRALWAPALAHAGTNAIAWTASRLTSAPGAESHTLLASTIRAEWWMPVVGLAVALPWLVWVWRERAPMSSWRFERPPAF